jgi:hypothetical protein
MESFPRLSLNRQAIYSLFQSFYIFCLTLAAIQNYQLTSDFEMNSQLPSRSVQVHNVTIPSQLAATQNFHPEQIQYGLMPQKCSRG